ncbi:MAG: hypothetical protein QOJ13_1706 [Gaiellales bacterium]|jgi:uncharacterized protein YecE (DUF72 family)|nr:hypothetical protein [Gaiellales bacterium]
MLDACRLEEPPREVRVGCSGWNYRSWKEPVYHGRPASQWLALYARRFDTVEVNATFYRLPTRAAVERWVEQTPEGFLFTIKGSRYLTHYTRLTRMEEGWELLWSRIEPLGQSGKLGPILWQLPERFTRDDERLESALRALPQIGHCFEFRHPSWFCEPVYRLLERHRAALVIGVQPDRPFQELRLTTGWTLIRFHYGRRGRRGNFSERELQEWRDVIEGLRSEARVFAYFNNDWEAFAVKNALRLRRLLEGTRQTAAGRR